MIVAMNVAAITPLFAPSGRLSTFHEFKRQFKSLGIPLYVAELSYNGVFESHGLGIKERADERNIMWQKEALLNALVDKLPAHYDAIALIDCDIIWPNSKWIEEGKKKLKKANAVQLFEKILYYNKQGSISHTNEGWVAHKHRHSPGGAWLVRREMFPLIDYMIVGGGDRVMTCAWSGTPLLRTEGFENNWYFMMKLNEDMNKQYKKCQNKIDYVDTPCFHLFHGDVLSRYYQNRLNCIGDYWFNPDKDITHEDGILAWTRNADPKLRKFVKNYFNKRNEPVDISQYIQDGQGGFSVTQVDS